MYVSRIVLTILVLLLSCVQVAAARPSSTLSYTNPSPAAGRQLILRLDGDRLVIVDAHTQAIVASARAADTERVVVRGAADRDDTLTLDLENRFSLARGIDYDGGADGWDTLVISGTAVRNETVTQLTPHDGVIDLDGLVLRYTNLEPVTDTVPTASLTVTGSAGADTVTVSDGPGAGEATISSPTFESFTFANKTNVVFDGGGGNDSVTLNNPNAPTGLASFIIQNVATVGQTATFSYPAFGVSATGTVDLDEAVGANNVANIEIVTQSGAISYRDVDAATIGGVSATLAGLNVSTNGSISFITSGVMTLADTDGLEMVHAGATGGDVFMQAFGIGSDIVATVDQDAITAPRGSITLVSGRDISLGATGLDSDNDVRASSFVALTALRDIVISGFADVSSDDFGQNTGGNASATVGRDFLLSNANGSDSSFGASGSAGADAIVIATPGSANLSADSSAALFSNSGFVSVTTNRLVISATSGISANAGSVLLVSSTVPVDLGSATDAAAALEISDAEADRTFTPSLIIQSATGFDLTVTQPITYAAALTLRSANTFTATGTGSLNAPTLTFDDVGAIARTWTVNATAVTISPGAAIPYSGVATLNANGGSSSDTFNVTPSATTTINVDGNAPTPPALPGDALSVDTTGTTSPFLSYTSTPTGYTGSYTFGNRAAVNFTEIETLLGATADLGVTKTDGATTETPGTTVTYTIVATNAGPLGVAGATVTDTFAPTLSGVTWTCTASAGSTCNPSGSGNISQVVNLAVGGTATFTVTATISPTATGTLTNTVTIAPPAGTTDPNPGNDTATDADTLVATADLSVTKTPTQSFYVPGGTITYTIVLTNAGPSNAANVTLTDPLPANTTFASLSAPGGFTCTTPAIGAGGTVSCTALTLAPSSNTFTLVVNVSAAASTAIANTASVTATSTDPNGANNAATASLNGLISIPALSREMLLLLAAMLGLFALAALRRA